MDHDSVKLGCEWNLNSHTRGFIAANVDGKKNNKFIISN